MTSKRPPAEYDPAALHLLEGLAPVRERGPTILNGAELSADELQRLCEILAANKHLWQIEVLDAQLRRTTVFRGQMPSNKLISDPS
ncbi:hypothetical protein [Pseudoxanthomonas sp. Root65]|uniref:hypothetical protein n=1 Tax=Pseudoxanthomonas sp. Root65 TaxID=1736576 RepID=UPI000A8CD45C|nr:hypothetical protein [Pseudoxanthomonas sp. Root65]